MKLFTSLLGILCFLSSSLTPDLNEISTNKTRDTSAATTGKILGRVTDKGTGKPIELAVVSVIQNGIVRGSAYTEEDGTYEIKGLPAGTYSVSVQELNHHNITITDVTVAANEGARVDIKMVDKTIELETLVVKYERPLIYESENCKTIDRKQLVKSASRKKMGRKQRARSSSRNISSLAATTSSSYSQNNGTRRAKSDRKARWSLFRKNRPGMAQVGDFNTEEYGHWEENRFFNPVQEPLSTFSLDVDAASYSNLRRFINQGQMPPAGAVRIEEMINYFPYDYKAGNKDSAFAVNYELSDCPWNKNARLLRIGIKGKEIDSKAAPANNLVFLIDVSGSMESENKLPLVQQAFRLLVEQLRPQDKVAIVVYAGSSGLVLPATSGTEKNNITEAIERLRAGGSTAGSEGIKLAYKIAIENFIKEGNNRVILATDGDFNVGVTSDDELVSLIEEKRKAGVFLTVLGFGMGNYKDTKLELLADKGNGNYAYIDDIKEAKKVFVTELGSTLHVIAKDMKLQLEFNPAVVKEYRLVGYENRVMENQDFDNDAKDAGDVGAGKTVTAFYEIIMNTGAEKDKVSANDSLRYQVRSLRPKSKASSELLMVKIRYKDPDKSISKLTWYALPADAVAFSDASPDFRFAAAVAEFGMLLRNSQYKGSATYQGAYSRAKDAIGTDPWGYRNELVGLIKRAVELSASAGK